MGLFSKKEVVEAKELDKLLEKKKPIKKLYIVITLHKGDAIYLYNEYEKDYKISYIKAFYPFYNWFFNRSSEKYHYDLSNGAYVIVRDNIAGIRFYEEIK